MAYLVWVGRYLKEHSKPIAIVDPHGCSFTCFRDFRCQFLTCFDRLYSPLLAALQGLALNGLVRPNQLRLLFVTTDLNAALDHIQKAISEGKMERSERLSTEEN